MNLKKYPIGTVEEELVKCQAAWKAEPNAKIAWCCHHAIHIEPLCEPAENRVKYILAEKPEAERAIRLRNFRPFRLKKLPQALRKAYADREKVDADWEKAYADWQKAYDDWRKVDPENKIHNRDWPDNTWSGSNIFD